MADTLHSGHRGRIDEKSRMFGFEFLEEHEQLEKLLFAVIPRGNTNEIAHDLLDRFGSIYGVLTADTDNLKTVEGVGNRTAEFLHDLMPILGVVERCVENGKAGIAIDSIEKAGRYTKTLFYGKVVENLYMISLNSAGQVIRFDKISEGTASASDVSVHRIAKLAVSADATAVVLAHNHPGGKLEPSYADLRMTRDVKNALDALGIRLFGHIIVSGGRWINISEY